MGLIRAQIKGHESIRQSLESAIVRGKLSSALLFRGPEAVGKKQVALSLAQDLLCEKGPPACGICGSCLRVFKGQHEGLLVLHTDEVSLKLDDIQPIFDFVRLKLLGRARVIVINDAHKLNIQAANRLLKTIEEPPPQTFFILVTSQESLLPITIRSRCQLVRFGPLDEAHLKNLVDAASWAYKASQGRLDILQRLAKESGEERRDAFDLFKAFLTGERSYLFPRLPEFTKEKEVALQTLVFFEQFLRDLWVREPHRMIHRDLEKDYEQFSFFSGEQKGEQFESLWLQLQDLKRAIEMNADRNLNLENFWFNIQDIKNGSTQHALD